MGSHEKQRLESLFNRLSATDRAALMRFAEFLAQGTETALPEAPESVAAPPEAPLPEPESIPRPEHETVVDAVKRLSKSYFMLNKRDMLGVTSDLMTQHIVQGRDASDVIDDLEAVFQDAYQRFRQGDG